MKKLVILLFLIVGHIQMLAQLILNYYLNYKMVLTYDE